MEKKEKKSRKRPDDEQSYPRRSTRSKTRKVTTEMQSGNENGLAATKLLEKPSYIFRAEVLNLFWCKAMDLTVVDPNLRSQRMHRSLEENLLAFLDCSAVGDPEEILEDKMMFIEATHSMCVVPNLAHVPTPKMYQAILQFIQECNCLGLTMASFQLLADLEKRHPRVALTGVTSLDPSCKRMELIVDEKVWSLLEDTCKELSVPDRQAVGNSRAKVSSNIFILLETIANRGAERPATKKSDRDHLEWLGQYTMFQHLMNLIQSDLHCRLKVFYTSDEDKDFNVVQGCYLYRLICCVSQAEKRGLMMNLDSIMDTHNLNSEDEGIVQNGAGKRCPQNSQEGKMSALQATSRDLGRLASDLLVLIMKLETLNQEFGVPTTLAGRRNRLLFETHLSLCTKASTLDIYLKAVSDPCAKLKFIIDYFVNFAPKQVAQDLVDCSVSESMDKLLSCFTDQKILKTVVKVFKEEYALPLLLSHAFQAFILLHSLDDGHTKTQVENSLQESRTRVCKSMIIAFNNLKTNERLKLLPSAEEILFVATRIATS